MVTMVTQQELTLKLSSVEYATLECRGEDGREFQRLQKGTSEEGRDAQLYAANRHCIHPAFCFFEFIRLAWLCGVMWRSVVT